MSENKIKHYVLDTCVLLHDPESLRSFHEHNVYLPLAVIGELDKFKTDETEVGKNCRTATRLIDELREKGDLATGVRISEDHGELKVIINHSGPGMLTSDIKTNDDRILSTAKMLSYETPGEEVILVTNDINMRVRANIFGIKVEPFGKKKREEKTADQIRQLVIPQQGYSLFKRFKSIDLDKIFTYTDYDHLKDEIYNNEYIKLINKDNPEKSCYGIYIKEMNSIQTIRPMNEEVYGILPKNQEQACALDALMDPDINLVTLIGKAGSGKTLIAIAAALQSTVEDNQYDKILISRPVQPMGKDIGYLPGTLEEKLNPWMQPIFDNLEFLVDNRKKHSEYKSVKKTKGKGQKRNQPRQEGEGPKKDYEKFLDDKLIQVEALTYIRGRSIPRQFIIIDEAQNLTPHEVKTIITRAGEGTKIVLTGDTHQIDSPYLDEISNGLAYATSRMKDLSITSHVTLFECERSALAEAGTKYL